MHVYYLKKVVVIKSNGYDYINAFLQYYNNMQTSNSIRSEYFLANSLRTFFYEPWRAKMLALVSCNFLWTEISIKEIKMHLFMDALKNQ